MKTLRRISQSALLALALLLPGAAMAQITLTVNSGPSENLLTWTYPNTLVGGGTWTVLRGTNGSTSESLTVLGFGTTNYVDTSAAPGVVYDYQIAYTNASPAASAQSSVVPGTSLVANGAYVLVNSSSGLAVSVSNNAVVQQNYTGSSSQRWTMVSLGGNEFALAYQGAASLSGPTPSAPLTLAAFGYNSDQEWTFKNVTTTGSAFPVFLVNNLGTGQLMDDLSAGNGGPVGQATPDGAAGQNWIMVQAAQLLPQIQEATVTNDDQMPQATVSAQIGPSVFPTTVIIQFGTNSAYGQAVTNTFGGSNGYQGVTNTFNYPSLDVTTTLHALVTVSSSAGVVTSGDITCSSLLFEKKYSSDFDQFDPRHLAPSTGSAAWLDFDNDGWLDLVHSGQVKFDGVAAYIIFNPGTNLNSGASWPSTANCASGSRIAVAVGDFDNDNRPDLFFAAAPYLPGAVFDTDPLGLNFNYDYSNCGIWYNTDIRNQALANLVTNASFTAYLHVQDASAVVADFDHTGRQDVLLSGNFIYWATNSSGLYYDGPGPFSLLLQNNVPGGRDIFTNIPSQGFFDQAMLPVNTSIPYMGDKSLTGISSGQAVLAAGDFDNDGFLDLFALNFSIDSTRTPYAGFFRGDGNEGFKPVSRFPLYPGLGSGDHPSAIEVASCVVADLNGDGYLDMVLSYVNSENDAGAGGSTVGIWLNDGHGNLTNSSIVLPQLQLANLAVGDIFNHGRNDILMVGCINESAIPNVIQTVVLRNDGNGVFTPIVLGNFGCVGETGHGLQLADYDKDGRLDFAMTGDTLPAITYPWAGFTAATHIFRNEMNIPSNAPPAAPPGLSTTVGDGTVTFHWGNATDDITPANLLTYNLRVGTNSLGTSVVSPIADVVTGWRKIVAPGNCGHTTNILYRFPPGTYYWSVQAVDGGFEGGAWAPEQTFTITNSEPAILSLDNHVAANIPYRVNSDAEYLQQMVLMNDSTNVLNVTNNSINVSWPTRFKDYTLEQATNLAGPWTPNTVPIGTLDGQYSVLVTNSGSTTFYRLVK